MQIRLKEIDESQDSSTLKIFDNDFNVDEMATPQSYLPKYQQSQLNTITANQKCLVCCGEICKCLSIPFALCVCSCTSCIYQLPTSQGNPIYTLAGLVQSFGKFNRMLKPGFNMLNPCAEEVIMVDLRVRILNLGRHATITKDNVKLTIEACVSFRATNPIIAHYQFGMNLNRAIGQLTTSSLRETVGQYNLDEVLSLRQKLSQMTTSIVNKNIPPGIKIENVFIEDISIPPQVEKDLTSAARQRRVGQAAIINSKADVESAALMKQSAQLLDTKAAMQIRYLEMVQQLGKNGVILMMPIGANKKGYKE